MEPENLRSNTVINSKKHLLDEYDYVIVGGGSAGCVLGRRLTDTGKAKILVLEAGGDNTEIDSITNPMQWLDNIGSTSDYFYKYEPSQFTNNRTIIAPRGKVLGGSGSINAVVWARGSSGDYDRWAAGGNAGWSYESVLPFFKRIEDWENGETDYHGSGGPIHVETAKGLHSAAQALIESSICYGLSHFADMNGPNPKGAGPMSMNLLDGKRCSSYSAYLKPVMGKENLTVVTNAQVTTLKIAGNSCHGVNFILEGGQHTVIARKEVILSAGAIETPRILMLSGIGCERELAALGIACSVNLPGVGQNLQDHPLLASLCFETAIPLEPPTHNLLGSAVFTRSSQSILESDLMIIPSQRPLVTDEIGSKHTIPQNAFSLLPTLIKVRSKGYVKMLTNLFNGPLAIQPNFLADAFDLEALTDAVEICLELANQPPFRNIIKNRVTPADVRSRNSIKAFIKDACGTYFHPVGTCAMGYGEQAVVTDQLRVHGIEGLRIADASIMPSITAGNTNAPTMMIAEFAAALIIKEMI